MKQPLTELTIWLLVGSVFLGLFSILTGMLMHEKKKPQSPQAVVVGAFNRVFTARAQKTGVWKTLPFQNTVGFNNPDWQALPTGAKSVQQIGSCVGMQPGITGVR